MAAMLAKEAATLDLLSAGRFGLSYYALFDRDMEAFAPIAARLASASLGDAE